MNNTFSFEQFCPKSDKNIVVNAEYKNDGTAEYRCSNNKCENDCTCINRLSSLLNEKRHFS